MTVARVRKAEGAAPKRARKAPTEQTALPDGGNTKPVKGSWLEPYKWQPGQSGNPNGRPRSTVEMKQKASTYTDDAVELMGMATQLTKMRVRAALDMLSDPAFRQTLRPEELDTLGRVIDPAGLAAASHILDRGHGKPKPPTDEGGHNPFAGLDDDELDKWIITEAPAALERIKNRRGR